MRTKEGWGNKCLGEALTISEMRGDRKDSEERSKQSGSHKQESWQTGTVWILNELSGQRRGKIIELLPMNDKDGSGALRGKRHPAYLAAIALGGSWTGTRWQLMLLSLWHISKREMGMSGKASNLGGELKKKEALENSAQTRRKTLRHVQNCWWSVYWWAVRESHHVSSASWEKHLTAEKGQKQSLKQRQQKCKGSILERAFLVQWGGSRRGTLQQNGRYGSNSFFLTCKNCFLSHVPKEKYHLSSLKLSL